MKVRELIDGFDEIQLNSEPPDFSIHAILSDSRLCREKDIFCLYETEPDKSVRYIQNAYENGTRIFLIPEDYSIDLPTQSLTLLRSKISPRYLHGFLSSKLCGHPSHDLSIFAVTGTNGKTSTTSLLYHTYQIAGILSGLIGTISIHFRNEKISSQYTTPDPWELQSTLKRMKEEGIKAVFLEASSHGLKLHRLNGIELDGALFTNLTPDHRDFHPTFEDYFESKFHLFHLLSQSSKKNKLAVLSKDSPGGNEMLSGIRKENFDFKTFTLGSDMDSYRIKNLRLSLDGSEFDLESPDASSKLSVNTSLLGEFNSLNLSLSMILLQNLGFSKSQLEAWIPKLSPIEGRFQLVYPASRDRVGIVDYAHTPDALENILSTIQKIPHSRLITVFGCGGDRDKKKRPEMGAIAQKYSDVTIITSDNPRTEDPLMIIQDIMKGIDPDHKNCIQIPDRREAIVRAVKILPENGFLLVAGKGHENYQILGTERIHFSDYEELSKAFLANNE